jgi:hypothetical protein
MEYDQEAGLLHLTLRELKVLREKRTPVDYRIAGYILPSLNFTIESVDADLEVLAGGTQKDASARIATLSEYLVFLHQIREPLASAAFDAEFWHTFSS